ncbi:MAG: hypothetical protein ABWX83_05225 [Luteibacter sp.]
MRPFPNAPILPLTAVACLVAGAAPAAERFVGEAYAPDSGKLLYREVHVVDDNRQVVQYQCPDGKAFARKVLDGGSNVTGPDFTFVDARSGDEEGVRSKGGERIVYTKRGSAAEVAKPLPAMKGGVIDAGFDAYVRKHWDSLGKRGESIPFLLPSRFAFYDVRLVDGRDTGGKRSMTMKLDSWLAFAAPSVTLTYTTADRQLRRFEGMGAIRGANGKRGTVRIEFPPGKREPGVADTVVDAAVAAPLDGRCTI